MHNFKTSLLLNWEKTFSMVYSDKSVSNIVSWSELNDVRVDLKINAVFNFLKVFCFCLIHHHETLSINFVKNAATSVRNLMNC